MREIVLFRWSGGMEFAECASFAESASDVDGHGAMRWSSEPMRPGFLATEVIPSWNARTPPGSFLRVELRGVNETGRQTKWYRLGDWGAFVRTSVKGQDDEDATVKADVLVAAPGRALASIQVRVTLFGRDAMPSLSSLHLLASAGPSEAVPGEAVPAESEPSRPLAAIGKTLDVPGYSQLVYEGGEAWCSAASTAMVLSYWGIQVSNPEDWVPYTAKHIFDESFGGCGNWPFNTAYAGSFGVRAFVTRLRSLNEAEQFIEAGIPLVVSASYGKAEVPGLDYETNGHLTVLVGFTADGDPVLNDPNSPSDAEVRKVVGRAQWEAAWLRSSRGIVYVIHPESVSLPPAPAQANW